MFGLVRSLCRPVLDALFPQFCILCKREGFVLCSDCENALVPNIVLACSLCHSPSFLGQTCTTCDSVLDAVVALSSYETPIIQALITAYKYEYVRALEPSIALFIDRFFRKNTITFPYDYLVPIPLHYRKFAERGFNQAEEVARMLSRHIFIPLSSPLRRVRHTKPQAHLEKEARIENAKSLFRVTSVEEVVGKRILLVDDVYTTGATMQACARALLAAGATAVGGFVLARG